MTCAAQADTLRLAYFHSELSRDGPGLLLRDILTGNAQVEAWIEIVRAANPDILVIGDVDFDLRGVAIKALANRLNDYPNQFTRRPNRGLDSGRDLDGDGTLGEPEDAEGFGRFAGQGGMAVLSRVPILTDAIRDHSDIPWRDLPGTLLVGDGRDPTVLSTTVHWDLPVEIASGQILRLLIWHGTAPVFDGPEDRNGRRNHDETAFWRHYIEGVFGEAPVPPYVVMGTANADPMDGESRPDAIRALISHPKLQDAHPRSLGAVDATQRDGGINMQHLGSAALDTVDWPDGPRDPGNLRVDYILPSAGLQIVSSGVLWPQANDPLAAAAALASRHRLIWLDVEVDNPSSDRR